MTGGMAPLHGSRTHPLSRAALDALRRIEAAPVPRQELNPGLVNRLYREALVEPVMLPSPYRTVKGLVEHLRIAQAGREVLNG